MKKKLLAVAIISVILSVFMGFSAMAERKTTFPIQLATSYGTTATVDSFSVTNVENLYGQYLSRIHYTIQCTGNISLQLECFDASGWSLGSYDLNIYSTYIDVPDITASIELKPTNMEANSDTYYRCVYMNVYSADGRVMAICDLLLPVYRMVGWYPGVRVYADDGRTMEISPYQVIAYDEVGWYTYEKYVYRSAQRLYNDYRSAGEYAKVMDMVAKYLEVLGGTPYEDGLFAMRTDAMDCWRVASGAPLVNGKCSISTNADGKTILTLSFYNVSYKDIKNFDIDFDIRDINGNLIPTNYEYYYVTYDLASGARGALSYQVNVQNADHIDNISVLRVEFADGTSWKR